MRLLTLAALAGLALPAAAQGAPADEPVVGEVEVDGRSIRIEVERDGDTDGRRIVVRRRGGADDGERVFRLDAPDLERLAPLRDTPLALLADGSVGRVLRSLVGEPGVSAETRERLRELEAAARDTARRARGGDADARRELDAVLGALFDARAEARRERAAALRAQADAIEAALRERDARRQALIDARRAELLGEPAADW